jgi:hypothetical protein
MVYYNLGSMVDYLDLYDIEKERYAKEMATGYGEYLKEMIALKWEILSYGEWKKTLEKKEDK